MAAGTISKQYKVRPNIVGVGYWVSLHFLARDNTCQNSMTRYLSVTADP